MSEAFEALLTDCGWVAEVDRLARYARMLERWGEVHNLVAYSCRKELVERHLMDALSGAALLARRDGVLLDVGSGAGLPGVPLLIVSPRWRGVLMEPRVKRWAFLRTVVRELGLAARVSRSRYEELMGTGERYDMVVSRGLGGYPQLLAWARPRLSAGGEVVLWVNDTHVAGLERLPGWRVISSPLPVLKRGRLARLQPCFT